MALGSGPLAFGAAVNRFPGARRLTLPSPPAPGSGPAEIAGAFVLGGLAVGVVAGVLAILLGLFSPLLAAAFGLLGGIACAAVVWRRPGERGRPVLPDLVLLALLATWVVLGAGNASQHVFPGSDPGVYVNTAWWLTENGDPTVEFAPDLVADSDGRFSMSGFFDDRGDGRLSPQFLQGLPVVLAVAAEFAGAGGLFLAPVLLGAAALLAVYLFATALMGRWWALLATASMSVNLVFVHFSRDAYTEPLTLALIFGSGWLLLRSSGRRAEGLLAGLMLGAALCVRIDALMVTTVLPMLLAATALRGRIRQEPIGRAAVAAIAALIPVALVAFADLMVFSPTYWDAQRVRLAQVALLLAAGFGGVLVIAWRRQSLAPWLSRHRTLLTQMTTFALVAWILLVWVVRPLGPPVRSTTGIRPFVGDLLAAEGAEGDGTRTLAEMTGVWLWWYLGPMLLAGLAGLVMVARRAVSRLDSGAILLGGLMAMTAVVYLWNPVINPVQPWAMRRFIPVVVPGLVVAGSWFLSAVAASMRPGRLRSGFAVVAVAVALTPVIRLLPVVETSEQAGGHALLLSVCDAIPPDSVLFAETSPQTRIWGPPLLIFCGNPVVVGPVDALAPLMEQAAAAGGDVLWFGVECRLPGEPVVSAAALLPLLEFTVTRPPSAMGTDHHGITVVRPLAPSPTCSA